MFFKTEKASKIYHPFIAIRLKQRVETWTLREISICFSMHLRTYGAYGYERIAILLSLCDSIYDPSGASNEPNTGGAML